MSNEETRALLITQVIRIEKTAKENQIDVVSLFEKIANKVEKKPNLLTKILKYL